MKKLIQWVLAATLICSLGVFASCTNDDNPSLSYELQPSKSLKLLKTDGFSNSIYTFDYPSVSATGQQTVLSAALIAWTPKSNEATDSIESLHIVSHLTITSDAECPTTTDGNSIEQIAFSTVMGREYKKIFSSEFEANYVGRSIAIIPDYEGYGTTKGVTHPYLSQRLTAQQVMDAVEYGLKLYRQSVGKDSHLLPIKSNWRTYAVGFSQGGAVTLAVHRHIEENNLADKLHFQGSICGDGPYDMITTLRYYFDDNGDSFGSETQHRKGIVTMPVVLPLIIKGLHYANKDLARYSIDQFLSQEFINTGILNWIESKQYSTSDINSMWYKQKSDVFEYPQNDVVWARLDKILTPACYAYLSNPDNFKTVPAKATNAMETLHIAMAENDLTSGWTPKHRIQFFHSKNDMVVPYSNWLAFRDAHPDLVDKLIRVNDTFNSGDHIPAGTDFFLPIYVTKTFGPYFDWLNEDIK